MLATGIENGIPAIQGGRVRVDKMEKCRFCQFWQTDFDLVGDLKTLYLDHNIRAVAQAYRQSICEWQTCASRRRCYSQTNTILVGSG